MHTTYTGRRNDSTRKKLWLCIRYSSISVLISHTLDRLSASIGLIGGFPNYSSKHPPKRAGQGMSQIVIRSTV